MRPLAATHTKNAACLMLECEKAGGDFISHVPLSDVKPQNADPRPILKAGGIVGLGGGGYPAWRKWRRGLRLMIVNAVEGDPHISCDVALLKEQGQSAVNAAKRTGQRLSAEKTLLAITTHAPFRYKIRAKRKLAVSPAITGLAANDRSLRILQTDKSHRLSTRKTKGLYAST